MRLRLLPALLLAACDPHADLPLEGEALQQAIAHARLECRALLAGLEAFRQDFGRYPTGREGLAILARNPDPPAYPAWHGPYGMVTEDILRDPWGRRYELHSTDTEIAVVSWGRDRRPNTGDEVREAQPVDYYAPPPAP